MEPMEIPYLSAMLLVNIYKAITWCIYRFVLVYCKPDLLHGINQKLKEVGVQINGPKPSDPQIHGECLYFRVAQDKTLGLGEAYMDGWWDCDQLDEACSRTCRAGMFKSLMTPPDLVANYVEFQLFNLQTGRRCWEIAEKHYNIGNHLFESFLDPYMNYTCGYWKNAKNLEEAQLKKMELIARKLKLEKGMKVLDLGCGWGGLCKYLAESYGVSVVGVTVSDDGVKYAKNMCAHLPQVDIRLQDYRCMNEDEKFDRIVAVGLFEPVGHRNCRTFMELVDRCLVYDGIFLMQTIGVDNDCFPQAEPFLVKHIFPNSMLPLPSEIARASHDILNIEDWQNIGLHYDKTLLAWHSNFVNNWGSIKDSFQKSHRFYRMWVFYLLMAAGLFRARKVHCWQIVFTKGLPQGYDSVRL